MQLAHGMKMGNVDRGGVDLLLEGSSRGSMRGKPLRKYSSLPNESRISVDEMGLEMGNLIWPMLNRPLLIISSITFCVIMTCRASVSRYRSRMTKYRLWEWFWRSRRNSPRYWMLLVLGVNRHWMEPYLKRCLSGSG